ncbi:MAG: right-handed parallel beta-helix repeat-containing protein [Bacteroidota bacterium]
MRKKLHCLLYIIFLLPLQSPAQWTVMNSGTAKVLSRGCFVSGTTGFVISTDGSVLKTTDTGLTWNQVATLPGTFTIITNCGPDTVYAGGKTLFRSTDAGNTWNYLSSFSSAGTDTMAVSDLMFFNSGKGFAVIPNEYHCSSGQFTNTWDEYHMYQTSDYGSSWQRINGWDVDRYCHFQKLNDSVGFISGRFAAASYHCQPIWDNSTKKTTNKGNTWTSGYEWPGIQYSYFQQDTGYFIAENKAIYKTADGGHSSFPLFTTVNYPNIVAMKFINNIDGYILDRNGIYVTRSEGFSWATDYTGSQSLNNMFYAPSDYLFVCGSNGLILRKHITQSTQRENIYRIVMSTNVLKFDSVWVNTNKFINFTVTNTGNTGIDLKIKGSAVFRVGSAGSIDTVVTIHIASLKSAAVYSCFTPPQPWRYSGSLLCSADSLLPSSMSVSGTGYSWISGNIIQNTTLCGDTVNIGGNVTVQSPAILTICKGAHVRFLGNYLLEIKGSLQAVGEPDAWISFEPLDAGKTLFWGLHIAESDSSARAILRYCVFTGPSDYYAMTMTSGNIALDHCNFYGVPALYANSHATIGIRNCVMYGCGVAIDLAGYKQAYLADNEILNCTESVIAGNGIHSEAIIERNLIHDNASAGINASSNMKGSGSGTAGLVIRKNKIFNNRGGIYADNRYGKLWIQENEIYNNISSYTGGIRVNAGPDSCYITQNLVYNNTATENKGGGISLPRSQYVYIQKAVLSLNTVCNNKAGTGLAGSEFYADFPPALGRLQIFDNIMVNISDSTNVISFASAIQNLTMDYNCINQSQQQGEHSISADPLFRNPSSFAGAGPGLDSLDWSINGYSPCINKGDSLPPDMQLPVDFAGNPRIIDHRIDIGAYECQDPLAVPEKESGSEFSVFPNPASSFTYFSYKAKQKSLSIIIIIRDLNGTQLRTWKPGKENPVKLDLGGLSTGMYLLQIESQSGRETKKISIF